MTHTSHTQITLHTTYGQQIHTFIEDPINGAVICPFCNLEMAYRESDTPSIPGCDAIFYCGSGNNGDGHWILCAEVRNGAN